MGIGTYFCLFLNGVLVLGSLLFSLVWGYEVEKSNLGWLTRIFGANGGLTALSRVFLSSVLYLFLHSLAPAYWC